LLHLAIFLPMSQARTYISVGFCLFVFAFSQKREVLVVFFCFFFLGIWGKPNYPEKTLPICFKSLTNSHDVIFRTHQHTTTAMIVSWTIIYIYISIDQSETFMLCDSHVEFQIEQKGVLFRRSQIHVNNPFKISVQTRRYLLISVSQTVLCSVDQTRMWYSLDAPLPKVCWKSSLEALDVMRPIMSK